MASEPIKVLDAGYVQLVEAWGSDERIVEAARMSTGKGFLGWGPHYRCAACGCLWRNNQDETVSLFDAAQKSCAKCDNSPEWSSVIRPEPGDERLLKYLWDHAHATPFEMAGLVVEVKAPLMVFREWHRHRTQSYNEMSARYVPLPDEHYVPSVERLMVAAGASRQAGVAADARYPMTVETAEAFRRSLARAYDEAQRLYRDALDASTPKELARLIVPVGRYSRMRASANLRNWLGFLKLRCDPAAQWEIREYARAVASLVGQKFPRTYSVARESVGLP